MFDSSPPPPQTGFALACTVVGVELFAICRPRIWAREESMDGIMTVDTAVIVTIVELEERE